jgi:phage shock protein E
MNWTLVIIVVIGLALFYALKRASFVSAAKAQQFLSQGALVVDVRSPGEFSSGKVPGAVNLPLGEIASEAERQLPDKNRVLLLHCLSGTRSAMAQRHLKGLGYVNVHNLGSFGRANQIVRSAAKQ